MQKTFVPVLRRLRILTLNSDNGNTAINQRVFAFNVGMNSIRVFLLLILFSAQRLNCQSYNSQRNQVFLTNVLSNAVIGGIGGAINHREGEKVYKAFIRNFLKGGVGGMVKYTAKYQTYYLGMNLTSIYAPVNRLYFFLGHSMVLNAAYNRKLLEQYDCNFYGIAVRYNSRAETKLSARLSLATVGCAGEYLIRGYDFNLFKSLEYGQLMFDAEKIDDYNSDGQARLNCIALTRQGRGGYIMPHEIVHTFQMYDYFSISSFYDKKLRPKYEAKKLYKALSKYVVADYEVLFFTASYFAQPNPRYYKNYFEFEAEHFKNRSAIKR